MIGAVAISFSVQETQKRGGKIYECFSPDKERMTRTVIVLVLVAILFIGYLGFFRKSEQFLIETPHPAPILEQQPSPLPPPPRPISVPPPRDRDTMAQTQQSSDFRDEERKPENLFHPAPLPNNVEMAEESGVASSQVVSQPTIDSFGPESAQNGGEFMGGISAFDKDDVVPYSAF